MEILLMLSFKRNCLIVMLCFVVLFERTLLLHLICRIRLIKMVHKISLIIRSGHAGECYSATCVEYR